MNWECIRLSKKINDQNPVITLKFDMKFVYVSGETPEKVSRNINRHADNRILNMALNYRMDINIFSNCIHVYFFFVSV